MWNVQVAEKERNEKQKWEYKKLTKFTGYIKVDERLEAPIYKNTKRAYHTYELVSVACHEGETPTSGHCTSLLREDTEDDGLVYKYLSDDKSGEF